MTNKSPSIPADIDTSVQPGRRYDDAAREFSESARVEPAADEPFPGSKEDARERARSDAAHSRSGQAAEDKPAGDQGKTPGG
ncbi:hypothetical protein [Piscinibacter koreensis]|uniref:Uncharacterized protein n=1 Tax=Piscinibacter koreensis TaxID=2742824 RepID=A0A7Y6NL14_9BURK|nr:hypothetical protein [Schlegelella koreensis]NUZ05085.1 hypothetical protein [Schlegelella koreensis]